MTRRDFLAASAVAVPSLSFAEDKPAMIPAVDTHQHLWDLTKVKLAWLKEGSVLAHSFTPKEYAEATAGLNVVKAVYMEVDVVAADKQKEADYVLELCKSGKTPTCAAVLGGFPGDDGFAAYVQQFKGSKYVKGIRQVIHVDDTPAGYCLDPKFVKGVQLLGDLGLSFDICIRPGELADAGKLCDLCHGTRFILDHCGNADLKHSPADREKWKKDMTALGMKKNLVGKVSGFIASAPGKGKWKPEDLAPVVNHMLDAFGPDRVMFGGDWPVVLTTASYKEWITNLREIVKGRKEEEQKKLFHDNAVRFYGLA
ncbi:MAG TPA: amidohydrolase family protein [Fimbriiglobus sp.]|jgi:predicted TIM-barrel fold metal-dependent hydrolase